MPTVEREIDETTYRVETYEAGFMETGVCIYRDGELILQDPCCLNTDDYGTEEEEEEDDFEEYLEDLIDRYFEDLVEMAEERCAWL